MDTGLHRYDGTESRYRCADRRCTCIFEGGHEEHEVRNINTLVSFVNFVVRNP